jgi:hypothetical protein
MLVRGDTLDLTTPVGLAPSEAIGAARSTGRASSIARLVARDARPAGACDGYSSSLCPVPPCGALIVLIDIGV